ncbi:carbon starvation CstA family protein, partial [Legionella sp. 29fVS95]|uniref:carbon starvation CstA family protein n=1 Tax=Legionella sp. 29fVS95 TaxID=3402813 RepID=UPI003AF6F053
MLEEAIPATRQLQNHSLLTTTAETIGEQTILSRTGGAPTLAIGIAQIFSQLFENKAML